jgi:presenilin-like A22 family membrane protease
MSRWYSERSTALAMGLIFFLTVILGMLLAIPFLDMGYQAFEDPQDVRIPLLYIVLIIAFSALVLLLAKKKRLGLVQGFILFACGLALMYVLFVPYGYLLGYLAGTQLAYYYEELSYLMLLMSICTAVFLTWILYKYPEWYVVNTIGIIIGAGIIAILGISLGILPLFILMIALALYDAISVYKTKHMIALADVVTEKHLPVVLVMPKKKGYKLRKQPSISKSLAENKKREAMFMGLGDIVFPGSLAISAMTFLSTNQDFSPTNDSLAVAFATLIGSLVGYAVLMRFVLKGRPQAGLPLLNAGAILGFAVGYFIVFRDLGMGIW